MMIKEGKEEKKNTQVLGTKLMSERRRTREKCTCILMKSAFLSRFPLKEIGLAFL